MLTLHCITPNVVIDAKTIVNILLLLHFYYFIFIFLFGKKDLLEYTDKIFSSVGSSILV